ncbi:MAG: hypothetical protein KDB61_07630 [Planctomycetes bacterium]|nr:hypothetical protein [Planctomycetota bacterium]
MIPLVRTSRALALLSALTVAAQAQTVTVTTTQDVIDINSFTGTIADLPGPDGLVSLSEAMIATNNTPGHQTVAFAIPPAQLGWISPAYDGIAVFHSSGGFYWRANDEVTIDGTTQTAFAGDTNPNGAEIQLYGNSFYLNDSNSTLKGFHATPVQSGGMNNLITENTGGMNLTLFAGGGSTVVANECGTIKIDRSNDNVIIGNVASRVRVLGFGATSPATNNRIGGPLASDRNVILGFGTINSEGLPSGAAIQIFDATDTLIENNSIGTTADGMAQGNMACSIGISFESENHDITVRNNRIAGIKALGHGPHYPGALFGWAVYFWGTSTGILIENNTIGLDANGAPTLGSVWGVNVDNFAFYNIQDVELRGNTIAGHILTGVRVAPHATLRLSGNAIYDNGSLGIDLIPTAFTNGVSANDPLDADAGGNGMQNFPVLSSASMESAGLHVMGGLDSIPNENFVLDFFASSTCDASGFGQGELFLGSTVVTTDGSGHVAFDVTLPAAVPAGWQATATATLDSTGATSEFSACQAIDGTIGTNYCGPAALNTRGLSGRIAAVGSPLASANDVTLLADSLPFNQFGIFLASSVPGTVQNPGGSVGTLCFGGSFGRYNQTSQIFFTGATGQASLSLDLNQTPTPTQTVPIQAGETWYFQAWHRDHTGTQSISNFTDAVEIPFQ